MNKLVYTVAIIAIVAAIGVFYINSAPSPSLVSTYDNVAVNATILSRLYGIANNASLANTATAVGRLAGPVYGTASLEVAGKPEVLYVGADYCPYCATLRWGLVLALMRFGNFSSLHYMTSSATDSAGPSTPTFTFYNATYSSPLIHFTEVELTTNIFNTTINNYPSLQNMTPEQKAIVSKNDPSGSIPFVDFGNVSVVLGSAVTPSLIDRMNWQEIIAQVEAQGSPISQAIIGEANIFTAEICKSLNNSASVCSQPYVSIIQKTQ